MLPWSGCQQIKCWKLLAVVTFKDRNPMKSDGNSLYHEIIISFPWMVLCHFSGLGTCMGFARSQRRTIASWFRPELECISSAIPTRVIWFYWASSLLEYIESGTVCLECRIGFFFSCSFYEDQVDLTLPAVLTLCDFANSESDTRFFLSKLQH